MERGFKSLKDSVKNDMSSIDPALPLSQEFSNLEYITMSFEAGINGNYEQFYFVNTHQSEQPPRVVLTIKEQQRVEFVFEPEATIGIKNSTLYYNPTHVTKIDVESLPCKFSKDGMHKWQEKYAFTNLIIVTCADCGHARFLGSDDLIARWKKEGFIA